MSGTNHQGVRYGLWWAQRCTRWDVYPSRPPVELVRYDWAGFHCPQPNGKWYKSPVSYVLMAEAHTPALQGVWASDFHVRKLRMYVREGDQYLEDHYIPAVLDAGLAQRVQ